MEKVESIDGMLDQRVQRWKVERGICDEAKEKVEKKELVWTAQWCQQHKTQLQDVQRRWGGLFNESGPEWTLYEDDEILKHGCTASTRVCRDK